ncbi:MAG: ParA family partition ATPase [Pseudomonadota bacterium]
MSRDATVITVTQQKGGAGKTTMSAHLAVALSDAGKASVGLLDSDPQGSLGEWFEAREDHFGEDDIDLGFRTSSGWGVRREIRALGREHDMVVVDTPPKAEMDVRPAIGAADLVVVPVQPTPVDLWATSRTLEIAKLEKVPVLIVLTRVPPRAKLTGEIAEALKELSSNLAETRIGNRTGFASSMGDGLTIMETDKNSKGADEVRALAAEVRAFLADR